MDLEPAQAWARRFVEERDWVRYHNPKNLAMALAGEVGELMEVLQWRTEQEARELADSPDVSLVREEVADIVIYALRLSDVLGIDLQRAVEDKLSLNEQRYPVKTSKGTVDHSVHPPARLRPYKIDDEEAVTALVGATLEELYPRGQAWLRQKLDDISSGRALCTLAEIGSTIVGLTIETVKSPERRKLSTIWVHESARVRGVGTQLVQACVQDWMQSNLDEVRVTARLHVADSIAHLLVPFGFSYRALEHDRYGTGQHELVLAWTPKSAKAAADLEWVKQAVSEVERSIVSISERKS